MSLIGSLYTGRSALITRQTEMSIIGSNVARADQVGYHRQVAQLVSNYPLEVGNLQIGTGTRVEQVLRQFDLNLENGLENSLEQQSYFSEYHGFVELLEQVMAQGGESPLTNAMNAFANSLQNLAQNPESATLRRSLLGNAERLAETFNYQYRTMSNVRDQIASSATVGALPNAVNDLNAMAQELANLNNIIVNTEMTMIRNQKAIDFRDQRDQLVKEMAKLAGVSFTEETDGSYTLDVGGRVMVSGGTVTDTLQSSLNAGPPPSPAVSWTSDSAALSSPNNGAISGLIDAYNYVQTSIDDLENYAATFANEMNLLHTAGFDINGNAGTNLFDASTPGNMTVLITDPSLVAASDNATNTGDGDNAQAMWNRLNANLAGIGNDSLRNHGDRLVDAVAVEKNRAESLKRSAESSVEMFKSLIAHKTGVSVDEEMVAMLQTQRLFQGAAKFVRATDELLQVVVNLV